MGCIYRRGKMYWIKYYRHGKQYAESTSSDKKAVAEQLLKLREGEIAQGKLPSVCFERVSFDDLAADFLTDYRINGRKTLSRAERCTAFLKKEFGGMRATEITTSKIKKYVENRLFQGVVNATINRELAALKRMFNLAIRCTPPKVAQAPYIPMLRENNVRKGFIEHENYLALRKELPEQLKPVFIFAYFTGWRKAEILNLKWNQVNLREGIVRLEPGETKNDEGRTLFMEPELCQMIQELYRTRRMDCLHVFHLKGKQILNFRKSWDTACSSIGKPDLLFHDLRRSAIRNMVRAGIPERVAMTISGHKTRSVFDRYNIVSQEDLKEAAKKLHAFNEFQRKQLQFSYNRPFTKKKVVNLKVVNL
jgi:integrase